MNDPGAASEKSGPAGRADNSYGRERLAHDGFCYQRFARAVHMEAAPYAALAVNRITGKRVRFAMKNWLLTILAILVFFVSLVIGAALGVLFVGLVIGLAGVAIVIALGWMAGRAVRSPED